jgi:hypothetical protein
MNIYSAYILNNNQGEGPAQQQLFPGQVFPRAVENEVRPVPQQ